MSRANGEKYRLGAKFYSAKILKKISIHDGKCWLWLGSYDADGYGTSTFEYEDIGYNCIAHRIVYTLLRNEIPDDLILDHICRNRGCVSPHHLRITTNRQNILTGIGHSAINSRKTHCKNGHEFTPANCYYYKIIVIVEPVVRIVIK